MNFKYERDKWYKVGSNNPKPQVKGSIYFATKAGKIYAGTYLNYSQYISLKEEIFEENEVGKWIIREDWKIKEETFLKDRIEYKGHKISIALKNNLSHYWQTNIEGVDSSILVKEPTRGKSLAVYRKEI